MDTIGIDKILITTKDYRIKDLSDRSIFGRNRTEPQGGAALPIYSDLNDNKYDANSFYHNGKKAIYDISTKGLAIHFNPSKELHPYNLVSAGDTLNKKIAEVEKEMQSIGIVTNIDTMKLSRFDLAKNQSMQYPLPMYHEALKYLKGKRSDSRTAPDGYYIGNKSHETIFYNKSKELKFRKVDAITPDNFARFEPRFKSTDAVKRYTTITSLNDLKKVDATDIDSMYKSYLNKVIFTRSKLGTQMLIDFNSEAQLFNSLKAQMPKGYFNYWLNINSIDSLLIRFGSIEGVKLFLVNAGENRMTIHRNIEKLQEIIATRGIILSSQNEVTPITLLHEIKEKFAA